jgi:hypothetical protein
MLAAAILTANRASVHATQAPEPMAGAPALV